MSVYNAELHCMMSSPAKTAAASAVAAAQPAGASQSADGEGFLDHVWNVINPLQHLPVVGTVYRAVTGEHIGTLEKIAGDTLYGGMWGAVSSIADSAFEGLTGKSAEDTVLAMFKSGDAPKTAIASNLKIPQFDNSQPAIPSADLPVLPQEGAATVASASAPQGMDMMALSSALSAKGVDSDTASRALYAYRRSMGATAAPTPLLASVN